MKPEAPVEQEEGRAEPATAKLQDLVPIAAVIGAGCEPCAERMVRRALQHGCPGALVGRTLGIVGQLASADCFASAVGPDAVTRMERALRAGREALGAAGARADAGACCG